MLNEIVGTIGYSMRRRTSRTRIILARCHSLVNSFAAHGALIAFRTIGPIVLSVFRARGSPSLFLGRFSKLQLTNFFSDVTRWTLISWMVEIVGFDYSPASWFLRSWAIFSCFLSMAIES